MHKYHDHSWHGEYCDGCTACGENYGARSFVCAFCGHEFGLDCGCASDTTRKQLKRRRVDDYNARFDLACTEIKTVILESTPLIPPLADILVKFVTERQVYDGKTPESAYVIPADNHFVCTWCDDQETELEPPRSWPVNEETLFRFYTRKYKIDPDDVMREYQQHRRVREAMATHKRARIVYPHV